MSEHVTVFGTKVRESEKAILIRTKDEREHWVPKSQIKSKTTIGDTVEVTIPEWLAEEKEMPY